MICNIIPETVKFRKEKHDLEFHELPKSLVVRCGKGTGFMKWNCNINLTTIQSTSIDWKNGNGSHQSFHSTLALWRVSCNPVAYIHRASLAHVQQIQYIQQTRTRPLSKPEFAGTPWKKVRFITCQRKSAEIEVSDVKVCIASIAGIAVYQAIALCATWDACFRFEAVSKIYKIWRISSSAKYPNIHPLQESHESLVSRDALPHWLAHTQSPWTAWSRAGCDEPLRAFGRIPSPISTPPSRESLVGPVHWTTSKNMGVLGGAVQAKSYIHMTAEDGGKCV